MFRQIAVTVAVALLLGVACSAQAAHPEMVVSTQWLADHLNDPKVVLLHVADKSSEYKDGHIPGARLLQTEDFVEGEDAELPSPEKLQRIFQDLGISDDSRIVIYTTSWYPMAGRAWFTLDYMGLGAHAALLDGGIEQWKAENRPVAGDSGPKWKKGSFTPRVNPQVRATLEQVKPLADNDSSSTLLVDARPDGRYRSGHIPGATHVYWQETIQDPKHPVFLTPEKLQELLASRGIKPGEKLITYCEIGLQASHMYFIARYLGYEAAMFDGSIHQWSHMNSLPVVAGEQRR